MVITLADVDDGLSLCKALLADWLRRAGGASDKVDEDNVLGELFAHLWHLYNKWVPGGLSFTSYATGIMRKRINTFVAVDVGDPVAPGRGTKAHSRSQTQSYEGLAEAASERKHWQERGVASRGGLDFAFGAVALDPTGDHATSSSWVGDIRDRPEAGHHHGGSVTASSSVTT